MVRMKKVFSKSDKVKERKLSEEEESSRKVSDKLDGSGLRRSLTNPDSVLERRRLQRLMPSPSPLVLASNNAPSQEHQPATNKPEPPSIVVKIHSELPNRNYPLLVVRLSPGDTCDTVVRHVTSKYGLPPHVVREYCLVYQSGDESAPEQYLGGQEHPYNYIISSPDAVSASLILRRRHFLGSNNYSDHASVVSAPGPSTRNQEGMSPEIKVFINSLL